MHYKFSKKKARYITIAGLEEGGDLLSHRNAVSSAQSGLTSLFGMVRGEPRRNSHLNFHLSILKDGFR
jgi:hypothetical protein